MDDNFLVLSAILLPRFKLHWVADVRRGQLLEQLKEELAHVPSKDSTANNVITPNKAATGEDFFAFDSTVFGGLETDSGAVQELHRYMDDGDVEITALMKYPRLRELFLKYNAAVPSSAPVERLFSIAGNVFQRKRGKMSDEHFEMQLLLRANKVYA